MSKLQFVFATHNANFPILSDPEKVIAYECLNDQIQILGDRADDSEIQKHVVDVLEGGSKAFVKRKQVCEEWKPKIS